MSSLQNLAALRARITETERISPQAWPSAPMGAAGIDAALPGRGLVTGALHELLPASHADLSATLGFGLGALRRILETRAGHILFVLPSFVAFDMGRLYPIGLAAYGIDPNRLVHLRVAKPVNVLWALEEALSHPAVAAAIGILPENDRAYDFTASRRLSMRAGRHGATAFIVGTRPDLGLSTAADMRWRIGAEASAPAWRTGQYRPGLGAPRWRVELIKTRKGVTGVWPVEWDHETLSFRVAAPLGDRTPLRVDRRRGGQPAAA
ncbi:ImuA family protein [Devosia nitrariae]|uniref:Protein ImuA n=1 Tax=Devosia nitrariae TaxID=2071872 RepID=A0ABQ5WB68_9HYPH|nr:inducible mutagenesis protein A [Devosia nitrariae]GLQ57108.1 protein ImuA [Devosia nitrariae]